MMAADRPDDETVAKLIKQHDRLVDEIQALVRELQRAVSTYQDDRDQGQIEALRVVLAYLRGIGVEAKLRAPLFDLLGELERRHAAPGEKRGPTKEVLDLAIAASAVHFLHRSGKPVKEAVDAVCSASGDKISATRLANFRKNLGSMRGSRGQAKRKRASQDAVNHYQLILSKAAESGRTDQDLASRALKRVRDVFGR